jgi:amino acid adenylation domain-containing protein
MMVPAVPVHLLVAEQARRRPGALAVESAGARLTYGELATRAGALSRSLRGQGAGPETVVALLLERSPELVTAALATLWSGAAYLPIDPSLPTERVLYMLRDSGARVLVTSGSRLAELPEVPPEVFALSVEEISSDAGGQDVPEPAGTAGADALAYVIYTSGSTGLPKGTELSHGALANLCAWHEGGFRLTPEDRCTLIAGPGFDASVFEMWPALLAGAPLHVPPPEVLRDPAALLEWMVSRRITVAFAPTPLAELLLREPMPVGLPLRVLAIGGDRLHRRPPAGLPFDLVNNYGPTEATVVTTAGVVEPEDGRGRAPDLGRPIDNLRIHLLDESQHPVSGETPGELCIAGSGLARGYRGLPELTAASFLPDPFGAPGERLYRSGDLVRRLADGSLEFLGRIDRQVKLRGFRVELGEIEAVLAWHPAARANAVLARAEEPHGVRLIAYVAVGSPEKPHASGIGAEPAGTGWKTVFDGIYDGAAPSGNPKLDPSFDIVGWHSACTGQPIPATEMREWLDDTVARIRALWPRRVLEIGCGTGMLLFQLAPDCDLYLGSDMSGRVIAELGSRLVGRDDLAAVRLIQTATDRLEGIAPGSLDTVIVNSVVQYFPSIEYLRDVLERVVRTVRPGGAVFLGDVRSLPLLPAFHAWVELPRAQPELSAGELRTRWRTRTLQENELVVDPAFFAALRTLLPEIGRVEILLKKGRAHNELSGFRYQVVLRIGDTPSREHEVLWHDGAQANLEAIRRALTSDGGKIIGIRRLPNARVARAAACAGELSLGEAQTAGEIRERIGRAAGVDPWDLERLAGELGYEIELGQAAPGTDGAFDAVFRRLETAGLPLAAFLPAPVDPGLPWNTYANDPRRGQIARTLVPELRQLLSAKLPAAWIPAAFVLLDELPLTPNGKVDREALARIEPEVAGASGGEAPRTPTEQLVAGVFAQVLGLRDEPGRGDDFFHLGGHSLLANRVAFRLREVFGVAPDLARIFESVTVEGLAAWIEEALRQDAPQAPPPERTERTGPSPLSFSQQSLWFLDRLQPRMATYNLAYASAFEGRIDPAPLAGALREMLRRHEALRTRFALPPGTAEPVQEVVAPGVLPWVLPVADLGALPPDLRNAESERLLLEEARSPYDLSQAPLMRALLIRQDDEDRLFLGMHHIVSDGWSMDVLHRELSALYRAAAEGAASPFPEPPLQIADFALWQRRWLTGERLDSRLAWWRERLDGAPHVLELPADRPRTAVPSQRGDVEELALGASLERGLAAFGRSRGATPFMVLLAAFQALLRRTTGQEDFLVGSPVANRSLDALEGLIGYFVNLLPLRAELADDPSFGGLVDRVRAGALGAFAHQDLPFERLVEELAPERDLSHNPLVQIVFALHEEPPRLDFGPGLSARPAALSTGTAKMDLALFVERRADGYMALAEYATDLFDSTTLRRLLGSFRTLLEGALAAPDLSVSDLPLLTSAEREEILAASAGPAAEIPADPVHVLVQDQARRQPEALAIEDGAVSLTYGELARRAGELARTLRGLGTGPESVVALLLERSAGLAVSALATLDTGGAYLPIDPSQPADRILYLLRDSGARALVTTAAHRAALATLPLPEDAVLLLNAAPEALAAHTLPAFRLGPDAMAYVIYTSGSTGLPKGTELRHAGLSNLVQWHRRTYGLTAEDRCALVAGPGFDASVWEIWPALASGASLHVPPADVVRTPPSLARWLAEHRISVAFLPTPLAEAVLAEPFPRGTVLRALLTGGDRLHRRPPSGLPFALVNHYGPTESTVVTTAGVVDPEGSGAPAIGAPIDNLRALVLDPGFQPLPDGVPGELHVAGPGLARGYRGRPEITAERFVPDPFGAPGSRLYRTGDRVRRLSGGTLEFLGRIDRQVKIRGFRIELGEIEAALTRLPGVREATVLVRPGESRITACIVPREGAGTVPGALRETLRAGLALSLPEAMVPAAWVFLDALPLTPNGKVDRRALERREPAVDEVPAQPAGTPMEQLVAGLFAQMLGLGQEPGAGDDFFHLGGHSLLATQLASRIREICGVELGVAEIFQRATVRHLAARIEEAARQSEPSLPPPSREERSTPAPLSFSQQSLWLLELMHPGTATYNIAREYALPGRVQVPALAAAIREVVRRHEALRTRFEILPGAGEPVQHAVPVGELPSPLPVIDLSSLAPEARRAEADRLGQDAARQPYDLGRATLFRATLVRLGDEGDRLQLGMHHIISDGWSVGVLLRELSALYRAALTGDASPLRELPLQYADFAVWQRRLLDHEALERRLGWWRERLQGVPTVLELPADRPRPTTPTYRGSSQRRPLGPEMEETLGAFGRHHGATPFMTLLATFQSLLHRFSGQQDLVIGSPVANRQWGELEALIGLFVNIVPLRGDLSGNPGLARLAGRVRDGALGAYAHQDLPFERIVEELQPPRDHSRSPLVQVIFALQQRLPDLVLGPGLAAPASEVTTATAKFDLAFFVEQEAAGLTASVEYATDLFDAATMRHFLDSFQVLLEEALRDPEAPLAMLPLLQAGERAEVLASSLGPAVTVPVAPVHLLVEEQARRQPEAPAIETGAARLTYGDLAARAGVLSRTLRSRGAGSETVVALLLERSPELVVAALATLRTGAAYLPIDPALPAERVLYMLRDSDARVLVTTGSRLAELPEIPLGEDFVLRIEELLAGTAGEDILEPAEAAGPDALAYVIYTSGSTGLPKGTELRHAGLANLCAWHRRVYGLSPEDRCSMVAGPGFDASVWEIWPALTAGASLHVPSPDIARNPPVLAAWLAERRISVAFLPTPVTDAFLGEPMPPGLSLRTLLTGGDRLRRRPPQGAPFTLVNHYGPTESTVVTTAGAVSPEGDGAPFIGTAIDNLQALVLDRALQPLPDGVPGELCVAGPGLARGYRGRPEMTAAAFVPSPFGEPGERLYRTGDLVRRRTGGLIEFLGRIDRQVKIRGFRVELGEIEAALSRLPEVREAAVLVRPGESRLTACVVPRETERTGLREGLRQGLARSLPEPMIPSAWIFLDALPLTANGKVDRRALEHLEPADDSGEEAGQEARNPTQQILAGLFAQVLGLDRDPGIHEDFFHLGGHSLLAAQLVSRLRTTFGVEVPLRHLFEHPTVARLAGRITAEGRSAAPPLLPAARGAEAELSFAQQRLWFLDRFESGSVVYNIPVAFRIEGSGLRIASLAAALDEMVRRHEALRTVFRATPDGDAVQVVQPFSPHGLDRVDLSALPVAVRETEAERLARAESETPFDLTLGPLLRTRLLQVDDERQDLLVTMHHIVSDGWSMNVFAQEVTEMYRACVEGRPSSLAPLSVQYADFALWQQDWMAGEVLRAELSWWRDRLAGLPPALTLPADRPRPVVQSFRGTALSTAFPGELRSRLAALSRRRGSTLFMTLLAAFDVLLHRYTGEEDLVVGTPVANRDRIEVEALIGFFVNTLVLRVDLGGDPGFLELLERVRHTALESYAHQDIPFEKLVAELAPERDLSHSPIYQVWISLQETLPPALALGPALSGVFREVRHDTSKFDLSLHLGLNEEGPLAACEYNTDIFDATTIERLLGHWRVLLEGIAAAPEERVSALPLMSETEQLQIDHWNREVHRGHPTGATLHGLFEAQARRTPTAIALVHAGHALTYAELERRSARLAHRLRHLGVGPEVPVAVCLQRSADLVVALLGVLRAGGFYVPLDPAHPADRLAFLLEDSRCAVLVTQPALLPILPSTAVPALLIEDLEEGAGELPEGVTGPGTPVERAAGPGHLAYLIYTSGSTGRPKAVAIEHRSAVTLVQWAREVFEAVELEGVLASTSVTFDLSVFEMFVPLATGGTVIVIENALALPALKAPGALPEGVEVRLINTVPSAIAELLRVDGLPDSVRTVNLAGEALPRALADRIFEHVATERLYNLYGPSEDTTYSTCAWVERSDLRPPAIGQPVDDTRAYVLDRRLRPLPVGIPGELCLAGAGLARGYLRRPELTAERFIPDPFAADPGERMYRTGDLARRRPDGVLEYLGRLDHQVKIRGFRIELGEVEAALTSHPDVESAVALARQDRPGDQRLVAYVVGRGDQATAAELRCALRGRLPEVMIPSAFVFLPALPLNPNGKVDRKALPAPDADRADLETAFVPPRTPLEQEIAAIWQAVLGVDRIGVYDSFWDLGGHSLLAMRLVSRIRDHFGVELSVRGIFEHPTLAGLAARIEQELRRETAGATLPLLPTASRSGGEPLSFPQQRLWVLDRLQPGSPAYNLPLRLRLDGPLAVPVLAASLTEIVRRHASLRTVFALDPVLGEPVQVILPPGPVALPVVDLSALPTRAQEAETEKWLREEQRRPFDLGRGPLLRLVLLRQEPGHHHLSAALHHIVADGWSIDVLLRQLRDLYAAFSAGRPSPLAEPSLQYADFAAWQRRWLQDAALQEQLAWWREYLAGGPPTLELPADFARPAVQTLRGGSEALVLGGLAGAVEGLGRRHGATLFMTLLAVFQTLLHRYTGQEDLWTGTPVANRNRSEIEGLIGFFVNILVLRSSLAGGPTFAGLLERVRETALAAYAHQELPFERLVEELAPRRDLSRSPLFQVFFSVPPEASGPQELAPGLVLSQGEVETGTAKFDLSIGCRKEGGDLATAAEFSSDLFEPVTVRRILGHFRTLLEGALADPGARIQDLPLLTREEAAQIAGWNQEVHRGQPTGETLHGLFESQARRTPGAIAVVSAGRGLTYAELEHRSARLARRLRRFGVGPEVPVAVCLQRSADLVVALLGVLRAGGFYVPLDPAHPAERLAFLLEDSRCAALLTQATLLPSLPPTASPVLLVDEEPEAENDTMPEPLAEPGHLAYLIYTSGSTGFPKAVAIEHRSAVTLVHWAREVFDPAELSGVLASTSATFDLSVFEMFVPLATGGSVIVVENALALAALKEPGALPDGVEVSLINTVPSAIAELLRMDGLPASLRTVNLAGEALPRALADRLWERAETERLYNLYGPSEDTTYSTFALVERSGSRPPAIGRPVHDTRAYVLDRGLRPLPVGVPGELCLAGAGLARGYLRRPDLTADHFLPDPFATTPGERMYRTGDLARRRPDGVLEYLGRLDHQVKIRGFRIELGEVEAALAAHPDVEDAVAVARQNRTGDQRLVGYVVRRGEQATSAELRRALRERLPEIMVPSIFVFLEALPRTANGKVDRKALPAPEIDRSDLETVFVAPRTPLEQEVAEIWQGVLGVDRIGAHDSFWDLGGHSLLATKVLLRIEESFGVDLPLQSLFATPTLGGLAALIGETLLADQGEEAGAFLAELEGLSDEEIRELLTRESEMQKQQELR